MSGLTIKWWQFFPYCFFLFCLSVFSHFRESFREYFLTFSYIFASDISKNAGFSWNLWVNAKWKFSFQPLRVLAIYKKGFVEIIGCKSKVSLVVNIFQTGTGFCAFSYTYIYRMCLRTRLFLHFPCNTVHCKKSRRTFRWPFEEYLPAIE